MPPPLNISTAGARLAMTQNYRTLLFVAALMPAVARAQATDPRQVQPERPTVATHAHTVAAGYLEIETGVEGDQAPSGRTWFAPTVLKLGLASHLQLNVGIPFSFASGEQTHAGPGDINVGLKWRLLDDDRLLGDFAILPAVKFANASASKGLGSGDTDLGITLISSHDLSGVAMDLNAAYVRTAIGTSSAGS